MSLREKVKNELHRRALAALHRRTVPLGPIGPIVTFSFDDFPRSALTVGAELLEGVGARATYYVTMSLMDTKNNLGEQFLRQDLVSALDRGHELGSHTYSHLSACRVRYEEFERDVVKGEGAIREQLGLPGSGNFAYPGGDVTLIAKRNLGPQFTSCRGTCGGLNGPNVDLNLLRANRLYGDMDGLNKAKRLILENERRAGWLIFYSHDVDVSPSPYGCTPKLLEAVCSFAAARKARLMTVAQVMQELKQQREFPMRPEVRIGNRAPSPAAATDEHATKL